MWSFRTSDSLNGWTPSAANVASLVTPGYVTGKPQIHIFINFFYKKTNELKLNKIVGADALQITATSDFFLERIVDLSAYAGCTLKLSATIKANGVTKPSIFYPLPSFLPFSLSLSLLSYVT